jgi:hypothetical protein
MFPALARRSKITSTSAETGTETRGGLVGEEMILVMCCIVQQLAAENNTVLHGAKDRQLITTTKGREKA